jgi:peptidoglycan/xylan/chitin deacetylase (PgdA/CDA1 family)
VPLAIPAALAALMRLSGRQTGYVIVYHRVGPAQGDRTLELVPALDERLFAAEVRYLARRYRIVPPSRILECAGERRPGEPFPVAITFDDDLRSHLLHAAPVLRRAGASAAFFLSGHSLDRPRPFWWEHMQHVADRGGLHAALAGTAIEAIAPAGPPGPYELRALAERCQRLAPDDRAVVAERLSQAADEDPVGAGMPTEHVSELARQGFEIGFHTRDHHPLTTLSDADLERAMADGREELAAVVGRPLRMISYPHGDADTRVASAARGAAFELGFTARRRPVRPGDDPLLIGRVGASYTSLGRFALALAFAATR